MTAIYQNKKICCTIVSPSHLSKGITMLLSLHKQESSILLYLIVTEPTKIKIDHIKILDLEYLIQLDEDANTIANVYSNQIDAIRWSMKPVVIRHLIYRHPGSKVIYADCDMYFFTYPVHLFNYLDQGGIVLTPHWRPLDPAIHLSLFRGNFSDGLFNAGCITANHKGIPALNWWAKACISGCVINPGIGLWADQRYLNLMLIYFPETVICRHIGYNVADWNFYNRYEILNKKLVIKESDQIILVHFTNNTIRLIEQGGDPILKPLLDEYKKNLYIM